MYKKKKELYNAEVKERFLCTIEDEKTAKTVRGHLKKFSTVEEKMGKDIAQMDIQDAIEAAQEIEVKSTGTLKNILASTRKYAQWCVNNEIFPDCGAGFCDIKTADVEYSSPNIYFLNEDDLLSSIHQVCEFDVGKPEVPYMVLCWLGLTKDDIISLKDSQVDLDDGIIYSHDGNILVRNISERLIGVLTQYASCKKATRQFGAGARPLMKDMSVDTFIKKMIPVNSSIDDNGAGVPYKIGALDALVSNLNTKYKEFHPGKDKITPNNALDSGRLFRLFMSECETGDDVTSTRNKKLFDKEMHITEKSRRSDYVSMYKKYKAARLKSL